MHQSDNMHDIQWRLRFKYLWANKCTTTGAFQVTSFIWLVLVNVDHRHIYRYMFITFTYHLQPQATSSSSIMQLVWSNLTVLHAALLQTASTDFIPVNEHRLVHVRNVLTYKRPMQCWTATGTQLKVLASYSYQTIMLYFTFITGITCH